MSRSVDFDEMKETKDMQNHLQNILPRAKSPTASNTLDLMAENSESQPKGTQYKTNNGSTTITNEQYKLPF